MELNNKNIYARSGEFELILRKKAAASDSAAFFIYEELLFHADKDFKKLIYVFAGR